MLLFRVRAAELEWESILGRSGGGGKRYPGWPIDIMHVASTISLKDGESYVLGAVLLAFGLASDTEGRLGVGQWKAARGDGEHQAHLQKHSHRHMSVGLGMGVDRGADQAVNSVGATWLICYGCVSR